jgi:hypothetical protein
MREVLFTWWMARFAQDDTDASGLIVDPTERYI